MLEELPVGERVVCGVVTTWYPERFAMAAVLCLGLDQVFSPKAQVSAG